MQNEQNMSNDTQLGSSKPQREQTLAGQDERKARGLGAPGPSYRIEITMYRCGKPLDRDNKWSSCKGLCDGLIKAFELPSDSEADLDYQVNQIRVKTRKEIKTEITIEKL